jgi:HlyD family secretion protein
MVVVAAAHDYLQIAETMYRIALWLVGFLGLAAAIAIPVALANPDWRAMLQPDPSQRFRLAEVEKGEVFFVVNSTGTVQPVLSVQVGAFVSGPVQATSVDFNTDVKEGDLLARIDPRLYEANVARDEASLAHREADKLRVAALLEQATNNERRALALREIKKTYISDQEMDQFKADRKSLAAQLEVATAAVKESEAALKVSRQNLDYTYIRAPVSGVVIDRKVDPGQTVAASFQTPVLFVVAPDLRERIFIYASVDEADIGLIRTAQETKQPVHFTVDAYPDLFTGEVYQIRFNPTTTQNVVTYTVVVQAANPDLKLLPGMTASLSFQIEHRTAAIKVPNAALRFFPKAEQVHPRFRPLIEGQQMATENAEAAASKPSATEKFESARFRNRRHVWTIEGSLLSAVEVVTGISDSSFTELVKGQLKAGQKLVTGNKSAFGQ